MKIIIAKSLVQNLLGVAASVEGAFQVFERDCDEQFNNEFKPATVAPNCMTNTKMKDRPDASHIEIEKPKSRVPHFNDITNLVSKTISIAKTDEDVIITVNDDFIEDVAEFTGKLTRKCMPLAKQYIKVSLGLAVEADALLKKWKTPIAPVVAETTTDTPAA